VESENYKLKHTLQDEVSIRIKFESEREGKQINKEIKWMNTVICFTEVQFQRT
jgi:DNA-directed RNA polymerase subunit L